MNAPWPADKIPGANRGLTEAEAALLAQLQRRPHALNKRERDQLIKLQRKSGGRSRRPRQHCPALPCNASQCQT